MTSGKFQRINWPGSVRSPWNRKCDGSINKLTRAGGGGVSGCVGVVGLALHAVNSGGAKLLPHGRKNEMSPNIMRLYNKLFTFFNLFQVRPAQVQPGWVGVEHVPNPAGARRKERDFLWRSWR